MQNEEMVGCRMKWSDRGGGRWVLREDRRVVREHLSASIIEERYDDVVHAVCMLLLLTPHYITHLILH